MYWTIQVLEMLKLCPWKCDYDSEYKYEWMIIEQSLLIQDVVSPHCLIQDVVSPHCLIQDVASPHCLIQDVASPHCGDTKMMQSCMVLECRNRCFRVNKATVQWSFIHIYIPSHNHISKEGGNQVLNKKNADLFMNTLLITSE
jgi:hypothetical protein